MRPGSGLPWRRGLRPVLAALLSLATISTRAVTPQPPGTGEVTTAFVGARAIDPASGQVVDRAVSTTDASGRSDRRTRWPCPPVPRASTSQAASSCPG
jgi:hypothetical protein